MITKGELNNLVEDAKLGLLAPDDFTDSKWAFNRLWKLVRRQRTLNKIIKELYFEAGIFSYHQLVMATANIARKHSIEYRNNSDSSEIWYDRYLEMKRLVK